MKKFDITNTSDWRPVALVCLWSPGEDAVDYVEMLMDDIAEWIRADRNIDFWDYSIANKAADPAGRFANRGTCDHCGAWFLYGAAFKNDTTDETMIVGNICAAKIGLDTDEYADKLMRDKVRLMKARVVADKKMAALAPNRRAALEHKHYISSDLRANFRKWHSLSIKQWALAKKLVTDDATREKEKAEDPATPIPAPLLDGRHEFVGLILGVKWEADYYGNLTVPKIVFKDDRGFKMYGTAPAVLLDRELKGSQVSFWATVEKSREDDTFGFFKRPTKAVHKEAA